MIKTPTTKEWKENEQFELIPGDDNYWKIRILQGDFIECVVTYGKISFDEQNLTVKFDFTLDYTPDTDVTSNDPALQNVVGKILHSIMVGAFNEH